MQARSDSGVGDRIHPAAVSHPLPAGSARHGGGVTSSPRVATLVRTIVDALGRHRGHSLSSSGSPRRWLGSCLKAANHLEQAREDLLAFRHFRKGALAPDLEYQPSRSA